MDGQHLTIYGEPPVIEMPGSGLEWLNPKYGEGKMRVVIRRA